MRSKLVKIFTFIGGLYFFLEFILPEKVIGPVVGALHDDISNGLITVGGMAVGLGILNILIVHGARCFFARSGWTYSLALLLGLGIMLFVTSWDWYRSSADSNDAARFFNLRDFAERIVSDAAQGTHSVDSSLGRMKIFFEATKDLLNRVEQESRSELLAPEAEYLFVEYKAKISDLKVRLEEAATSLFDKDLLTKIGLGVGEIGSFRLQYLAALRKDSLPTKSFNLLYSGLFTSLAAAMFSLLGFYIPAAAYRAFRVRSAESGLMMVAAFVVMLGQIPFGIWLWDGFPELRAWLLSVPSAAAFRAIKIGAGVAGLVLAYRMWFSIESEGFDKNSGYKGSAQ